MEYIVNISELETGHTYQLKTEKTSILVTALHPFYMYECSASAVTVAAGPYSYHVRTRTLEDGMDVDLVAIPLFFLYSPKWIPKKCLS